MEKNIEILADWWLKQLAPSEENWSNGDVSPMGVRTTLLGNFLAQKARSEMPADAPQRFKKAFVEKALAYYTEIGYLPDISVDYDPSPFLAQIAREAGINARAFPCKSYTDVYNGKPCAKCGYGEPTIEI